MPHGLDVLLQKALRDRVVRISRLVMESAFDGILTRDQ